MKNKNLMEKIGFILIISGVVFLALQVVLKINTIPRETSVFLTSVGLVILALGRRKRLAEEKK